MNLVEVVLQHDENKIKELSRSLTEELYHVTPLPGYFYGEDENPFA